MRRLSSGARMLAGLLSLALLTACDRPAEPSASLEVAARSLESGALSEDGGWALVGSGYHGGSLWRLSDGERLYDWNHKADSTTLITRASFSPDGDFALTTDERTLVLWNRDTGEAAQYWSSPADILAVDLGPGGERALLGLSDYRASLYNVSDGGIIRNFSHSDRVGSVALSDDGSRGVTGTDDGTATVWNMESGETLTAQQHQAPVHLVAMDAEGDRILSVSRYERPRLWNPDGQLLWELPLAGERLRRGTTITRARFSEDGDWLLTGQPNGRVDLWDLGGQRLAYSWRMPKRKAFHPTAVTVEDLAFTEDSEVYRALTSDGFVHDLTD